MSTLKALHDDANLRTTTITKAQCDKNGEIVSVDAQRQSHTIGSQEDTAVNSDQRVRGHTGPQLWRDVESENKAQERGLAARHVIDHASECFLEGLPNILRKQLQMPLVGLQMRVAAGVSLSLPSSCRLSLIGEAAKSEEPKTVPPTVLDWREYPTIKSTLIQIHPQQQRNHSVQRLTEADQADRVPTLGNKHDDGQSRR